MVVVMRRIGHRKSATLTIGKNHLQVLACGKLGAHAVGQAQSQYRNIAGDSLVAKHLDGMCFACAFFTRAPFTGGDQQIACGLGFAKEMFVRALQAGFMAAAFGTCKELALKHPSATIAANTFTAGVG
jgi:hypothetical protein